MIIGHSITNTVDEPTIKLTLSQRELDYITGIVGMRRAPHSVCRVYDQLWEAGGRPVSDPASLFIRGENSDDLQDK